jgi:protein-L-isoaspartate(D-aspartate) O-methyltransferase
MFGADENEDDFEAARDRLVERLRKRRGVSERVAAAMRAVPRHAFVSQTRRRDAYADRPLPIGEDQTVSAPHMVAMMCDRLDLATGETVLEIGTGCGYHAAVTAELVGAENVFSVEYVDSLAERARETLADLGYGAVSIRAGDGRESWPTHAPYDAAYLTCAAPSFPESVIEQVREGGRLLAPIGVGRQELVFARRRADGLECSREGGVRFVEMQ